MSQHIQNDALLRAMDSARHLVTRYRARPAGPSTQSSVEQQAALLRDTIDGLGLDPYSLETIGVLHAVGLVLRTLGEERTDEDAKGYLCGVAYTLAWVAHLLTEESARQRDPQGGSLA